MDKYDKLIDSETDWEELDYYYSTLPEMEFWLIDIQSEIMQWYHKRNLNLDPFNLHPNCVYKLNLKNRIPDSTYLRQF